MCAGGKEETMNIIGVAMSYTRQNGSSSKVAKAKGEE